MQFLIVVVVLFALFWVLMIRPQRRRQLEQSRMIETLEVGDEIVTAGGLYGRVVGVGDDELLVEIAPGTNVRIARRAIAGLIGPDDEEEGVEELESGDEPEPETEPAAEAASEKPS
jgi:preprotein translocase subunit YajC